MLMKIVQFRLLGIRVVEVQFKFPIGSEQTFSIGREAFAFHAVIQYRVSARATIDLKLIRLFR